MPPSAQAIVDELSLQATVRFVPFSKCKSADGWPNLNWIVTLHVPTGDRQIRILTANFTAGAVDCPSYTWGPADRLARIAWECEHGVEYGGTKPIEPVLVDFVEFIISNSVIGRTKLRLALSVKRLVRSIRGTKSALKT